MFREQHQAWFSAMTTYAAHAPPVAILSLSSISYQIWVETDHDVSIDLAQEESVASTPGVVGSWSIPRRSANSRSATV